MEIEFEDKVRAVWLSGLDMCRGEIVDLLESVSEVELPGRREKTRFSGHNEI